MTKQFEDDPEAAPEIAALLRACEPDLSTTVDWEGLRARVSRQAELPLARRRRVRAGRVHGALALAAAACVALIVQTRPSRATAPVGEPLLGLAAEQELDRLISGQAEAEALLRATLEGPERTGLRVGS